MGGYNTLAGAQEEWTSATAVGLSPFAASTTGYGFEVLSPSAWQKTLTATDGWIVNAAIRFGTDTVASSEVFRLVDINGALVVVLFRLSTGVLRVVTGGTVTLTADSATVVAASAQIKIDVGFLYSTSAAAGRLEVRINGVRENSLTSTAFTAGTLAAFSIQGGAVLQPRALIIGNSVTAQTVTYDAVGVQQDSAVWADPYTGFVNNRSKFVLRPNGEGTYVPGSNWSPINAATTYEALDELAGDQDATYITTNTVSGTAVDRSSWMLQGLPAGTTTITHVCAKGQMAAKPAGTNATVKLFLYNGSTTDGSSEVLLTNGNYDRRQFNVADHPGGSGWTLAQVNAVEAGVLVTALS